MRADFDQEKKRAVNVATRSLERDLERLKADHATEMEEMSEKNREELATIKKKQWVIHSSHYSFLPMRPGVLVIYTNYLSILLF